MPTFPIDGTKRDIYTYTVGSFEHEFLVRSSMSASNAEVDEAVKTWLATITSLFFASVITQCRRADQGSNLFFPRASSAIAFTWGSGTNDRTGNPMQLNFVGRSPLGVRSRLGLFGYKGAFSDWRLTGIESTAVQNAVDALNAEGFIFWSVDVNKPIWYPYANVGANDYWVKQSRAG